MFARHEVHDGGYAVFPHAEQGEGVVRQLVSIIHEPRISCVAEAVCKLDDTTPFGLTRA
jgi:hypothetical protein